MVEHFCTPSGIKLGRSASQLHHPHNIRDMISLLNAERGMFLSSGVEYPGRYTRWDIGFVRPPLEVIARDRECHFNALNERGTVLLKIFEDTLTSTAGAVVRSRSERHLTIEMPESEEIFVEEERSLQPSVFSPLRSLLREFRGLNDSLIGLYGAFGHDLIFLFEKIEKRRMRNASSKEIHLFLPDSILVLDRRKESLMQFDYTFERGEQTTRGRDNSPFDPLPPFCQQKLEVGEVFSPHSQAMFAQMVDDARQHMQVGDIYALVLHRRFSVKGEFVPAKLWELMTGFNQSPYEFLCQFGNEQLIGTSPEMFIRVSGDRIESCPISGTIRRGDNAMEDADAIRRLINSEKDEVELTMCTDVDRNDKARICKPGSIKLIDRRLIERYAGLFHTVDHVEGFLRPELTGIDAFLSHMWAATLTGSPKPMAVRLIEKMEQEPREWYGGAVGALLFNGDVSTGITIRTIHVKDGHAHYRVGASLVFDSKGDEEEMETQTKATVFFHVIDSLKGKKKGAANTLSKKMPGEGLKLILIDNEDSFVNILADYFRQTGAEVSTYRHGLNVHKILAMQPDMVVHSPGPGRPSDFGVPELVRALADKRIPQFGVCLGLQGIVEAFGGSLSLLNEPRQGKRWTVTHDGSDLFSGISSPCEVGAYHALYANESTLPDCLAVLARNSDGIIMAVRHRVLPVRAVQFHPESILSMRKSVGYRLIANLMEQHRALIAAQDPPEMSRDRVYSS